MKTENYPTESLYLAAFLYAEGIKLCDVSKIKDKRCVFIFEGGEKTSALADAYVIGSARVSPMAYKNAINDLKGVMFRDIPFGENGGNNG